MAFLHGYDEMDNLPLDMSFSDIDFDSMFGNDPIEDCIAQESHIQLPEANTDFTNGNELEMQPRSLSQNMPYNQNISAGAIPITPEEMVGVSTLILKGLWSFEVVCSNFSDNSSNINLGEQTTIVNISHPNENSGFDKSKERLGVIGASSSQSTCFSHHSNPIDKVPRMTSWIVRNNREGIVMVPTSNALGNMNILQAPTVETRPPSPYYLGQNRVVPDSSTSSFLGCAGSSEMPCLFGAQTANRNASGKMSVSSFKTLTTGNGKDTLGTGGPMASTSSFFTAGGSRTSFSDDNMMKQLLLVVPKGHIKCWEGFITSSEKGVTLFMSKLVAYKLPSVPETIFNNWPEIMELSHLVPLIYLNNNPCQDTDLQYLIFTVLDPCPAWDQMSSLNLCAYVNLPGQTIVLTTSKDKWRLVGTVYGRELPVYSHQIFKPDW